MNSKLKICILFIVLVTFLLLTSNNFSYADDTSTSSATLTSTPTPTSNPTPTPDSSQDKLNELEKQIKEYQTKISDLQKQQKTLSSQISVMDNQIKLTQLRINAVKQEMIALTDEIQIATDKISNLEGTLDNLTKVLIKRIVVTYEAGSIQPMQILFSSNSVTNFFTRANYLKMVQKHDKELIFATQQTKNDYSNQKNIFEDKKKKVESLKTQLEGYTAQLDQEKQGKQTLLTETQGSEANYQQLLSHAQAQLAAFSKFTSSQGGASLLSDQTQCDDWGCYYNQRDNQWGANALNGTSFTLASDGCLVTAMAMVYTHYGYRSVTPQTINSISSNFASYYPAYLNKTISVNGTTSQRISANIDSVLASGHPVVIGISYDSGSIADHFVVFISGSNGDYRMNDPFTPNGRNISFKDRYPGVRIVEIERVSI
ncbi:MAG: C39 family peptidase [Candidatus Levyibacteriota bacterium]